MATVDLLLDKLDVTVSLDVTGLIQETPHVIAIEHDAVADVDVSLEVMKDLFQIGVDGFDDSDTGKPTRFYVVNDKIPSFLNIGANSYMTDKPIGVGDINGNNYPTSYQSIKFDFVRYLANELFNTHYAVDLFTNQDVLRADVSNKVNAGYSTTICDLMKKVSTTGDHSGLLSDVDGKFLTEDTSGNDNLCRELYLQLVRKTPSRFNALLKRTTKQPLPLLEGDTIGFRVIVKPATDQQKIIDPSNNIQIAERKYLVRFNLKASGPSTVVPDKDIVISNDITTNVTFTSGQIVQIAKDVNIASGVTVTAATGSRVEVNFGVTLTGLGALDVQAGAVFINHGTLNLGEVSSQFAKNFSTVFVKPRPTLLSARSSTTGGSSSSTTGGSSSSTEGSTTNTAASPTLSNAGTFLNTASSRFTITSTAAFLNSGAATLKGVIVNRGTLTNSATLVVAGSFTNTGSVSNTGGYITVSSSGSFVNNGSVSGGTVYGTVTGSAPTTDTTPPTPPTPPSNPNFTLVGFLMDINLGKMTSKIWSTDLSLEPDSLLTSNEFPIFMPSSRSSTDTIVGILTDAMMMTTYACISKNRAAPSKLILPTYKDGDVNTYKSEAVMISYDGSTIIGHRQQRDGSGNLFNYPCVWNGDNTVNTILPVSNNDIVVLTAIVSCNASGSIIYGVVQKSETIFDNITASTEQNNWYGICKWEKISPALNQQQPSLVEYGDYVYSELAFENEHKYYPVSVTNDNKLYLYNADSQTVGLLDLNNQTQQLTIIDDSSNYTICLGTNNNPDAKILYFMQGFNFVEYKVIQEGSNVKDFVIVPLSSYNSSSSNDYMYILGSMKFSMLI